MQILYWNLVALLIAALYYVWRDGYARQRRQRVLRERITFMLWTAANLPI